MILFFVWLKFFSQQRALNWLLRGHMISNNETVSCQNLWAGNIAKSMTSEGNSALLPANVDRSHTEKVFFVGYKWYQIT